LNILFPVVDRFDGFLEKLTKGDYSAYVEREKKKERKKRLNVAKKQLTFTYFVDDRPQKISRFVYSVKG